MWIDSDIIFTPDQFFKLINTDKDIVSGLYKMQDNIHYATVEKWDDNFFLNNGNYQFMTPEMISKKKELFPVAYTGFGWMLMKKGVFESLEYPWFQPTWKEWDYKGKHIREFMMEDVSFCNMIQEKGYQIWINPEIVVGHEKMMVLI